ncbi:MAG: adenylate kinase family protein [Euryarchaeota archaeon]|nr:MAG: putative adenylate kinase [ANME-2 cluster archaeon]MEA1864022.1 adenylate kinase family protein [Euryarchaeota archaeon]
MIIGITGTPGTGKTSACALLGDVRDLNELIKKEGLHRGVDRTRGSLIADMDSVYDRVREIAQDREGDLVIEGHLSHHLCDVAIVLRLLPDELKRRLVERGYHEAKILENVEAEVVDVILVEAVEWCDCVYEIDTTGKTVEEVADTINEILTAIGRGITVEGYEPGSIDWLGLTETSLDILPLQRVLQ